MKFHAAPKPLHEPLAGGTEGATVAVEPIVAGHVSWPAGFMESPGGRFVGLRLNLSMLLRRNHATVPCPAFLIRHPSAGLVLVDTGLHPSIAADPAENFGRLASRFVVPSLEPGKDLPAQLRSRGVDPGQIAVVVMTHLHLDHASGISEFPNSTFVISDVEWVSATEEGRHLTRGYRPAHYDFVFDYRTIDYDRGGIDSYASFGRTFDLFGDGSVRIAFTPGHSAGHQSVIARLRERDLVIAGDVVYTRRQLDGGPPQPRPVDEHNWRRSLRELQRFAREYPDAVICPGHDVAFYEGVAERFE